MLDPDEKDKDGMPLTARCVSPPPPPNFKSSVQTCIYSLCVCLQVFIIGPDKRLKLSLLYPATTGRNFDEILRVVDSLQITAGRRVATPADWKVRRTHSAAGNTF